MNSTALVSAVIGIAVLGWLIVRQLSTRPLRERSRIGLILFIIGAVETVSYAGKHHLQPRDVALLAASALVGIALAAVRAYTVHVWRDANGVFRKGTWLTALLWVVAIGQHYLIEGFVHDKGLASITLLAYFGLSLLAQQGILIVRAREKGLISLDQLR